MRVAIVQYAPEYLQVEANLHRVEALIHGLSTDVVVLPELFASGYFFRSSQDAHAVAEPIPEGRTTQRMLQWAKHLQATIVGGLPEKAQDGYYNSAVVVTPEGIKGVYRKVHLYYEEKLHFKPGQSGFPVFECITTQGTRYRLGVMICFDWYFPEAARTLALCGADLIAHPSNLVRKDCPRAMPIRALENHVYTATANRTGQESKGKETLRFIGQSLLCDPSGEILTQASPTETVVLEATIDPQSARNRQITPYNDLFADRNPATYRCIQGDFLSRKS